MVSSLAPLSANPAKESRPCSRSRLMMDEWDGDLSKLSERSASRLLAQIEEKIFALFQRSWVVSVQRCVGSCRLSPIALYRGGCAVRNRYTKTQFGTNHVCYTTSKE